MTVRILLVDDHELFAESLAAVLGRQEGIDVIAVAATAADGLAFAEAGRPDVALVDLDLPDFGGLELIRRMRRASPDTRVIVLTGGGDVASFASALDAGVSGYLLKHAAVKEVADAIHDAHAGRPVLPAAVVGRLATTAPASVPHVELTRREQDVLALLAEGCDVKQVAKLLGVTWHTARSYTKTLFLKLDAHSQLEAVAKARRLGLVK